MGSSCCKKKTEPSVDEKASSPTPLEEKFSPPLIQYQDDSKRSPKHQQPPDNMLSEHNKDDIPDDKPFPANRPKSGSREKNDGKRGTPLDI